MTRYNEWQEFSESVGQHILDYTVEQYGDAGQDQATDYTREDCWKQVLKYANRRNSNKRTGQEDLDILKAAHYLCMAYFKDDNGLSMSQTGLSNKIWQQGGALPADFVPWSKDLRGNDAEWYKPGVLTSDIVKVFFNSLEIKPYVVDHVGCPEWEEMIKNKSEAWKDVPNATEWLEDLRGND